MTTMKREERKCKQRLFISARKQTAEASRGVPFNIAPIQPQDNDDDHDHDDHDQNDHDDDDDHDNDDVDVGRN